MFQYQKPLIFSCIVLIYSLKMAHKNRHQIALSVTYLTADASLTADPAVSCSIPALYHTFVEIDHEIISTVILLPFSDSRRVVLSKRKPICTPSTGFKPLGQGVVKCTDRPHSYININYMYVYTCVGISM